MSKKKTKSKVKAPSFTEVLKALYLEKITNKLSDEQFIVQVRAIAISGSKKAKVLEEEVQLLKIVAQNYIAIFIKGKIITSEDIKALASFTFEKWLKADDIVN
jgi:hypothetical protein